MKTRKRQKTTAIPDFPAVSADAMAGFTVDELLDSRPPPRRENHEAWRNARRHVLRLADERFDPRQTLGMTAACYQDWCAERLAWLRETLGSCGRFPKVSKER
jgi:hypothetical protein